MDGLIQDVRHAVRRLGRAPGFAAIVAGTLALGIGATTAIFSVVNGVLLSPLPFPEPDRLAMVFETRPEPTPGNFSYANFADVRAEVRSFAALSAWGAGDATLTGAGQAARLEGVRVSPDFFRVLGTDAAAGRTLLAGEATDGRDRVVVIGHGLWRDRLGGDPDVIGREVRLDGERHEVVGVMPPGFDFPDAQLWRPLVPTTDPIRRRAFHDLRVVGRLAPGVGLEEAQAEVAGVMGQLAEAHPEVNAGAGARVERLHDVWVDDVRSALLILLGAVGLLLLVACANAANLLLVRGTARRRELAVRAALGAGGRRIARQLLVESLLMALLGGAAGVLLALWGTDALLAIGGEMIPRAEGVAVSGRVLAFALALTLATGVLFGLAPAWRAGRLRTAAALRGGRGQSAGGGPRRLRSALVVAQLAVAVTLVAGAGLLARSFARLQSVDPGFRAERLIGFELSLPEARYGESERVAGFYRELFDRLEALPGVVSAGAALTPPLAGGGWTTSLRIEDRPRPESELPSVGYNAVSSGYFRTVGAPVLEGREFDARDGAEAPAVALINRTAAERFWPDGADAVGRRIAAGPDPDASYATIVGVVGDVREGPLERAPEPALYFPVAQDPFRSLAVVVRTEADPEAVLPGVREAVAELDPELPVLGLETAQDRLSAVVAGPRFNTLLLGLLAALALALACVGIYGVLAYAVARRTREIGIRMAVGARPREVLGLVLRDGLRLSGVGIALGLAAALAIGRVLSSLLFEVGAADPPTLGAVAALVLVTTVVATWLPARRAARVDPVVALDAE